MTDEEKRNKVKSFDRCVCERARALRSVRHLLDSIAFHFISFAISSLSSLKKWSQYFLFLLMHHEHSGKFTPDLFTIFCCWLRYCFSISFVCSFSHFVHSFGFWTWNRWNEEIGLKRWKDHIQHKCEMKERKIYY